MRRPPRLAALVVLGFLIAAGLGVALLLGELDGAERAAVPPGSSERGGAGAGTLLPTVFVPPPPRPPDSRESGRRAGTSESSTADIEYVPDRLLVKFEEGTSPATSQAVLERAEVEIEDRIEEVGVRVVEVPRGQTQEVLADVTASPAVAYVERDVVVRMLNVEPNDTLWPQQWGPVTVKAPVAWHRSTGTSNVVIAVLDTGIDSTHPDLQGALVAGYDFVNGDADASDDQGHGTAVAGIVAARTNNASGQAGICWSCSLMPVKVLDANGAGDTSTLAAAIVWAADHGARVISMSMGGEGTTQTLTDALNYAASRGVVLVAAAGNSGSSTPNYPAASPGVVAVAGTTPTDELYSWSNFGSWVQVAAPGCNVAPYPGGQYVNFCGTSSATPVVAGLAGLALSGRPDASRAVVEQAVLSGAVRLASGVQNGRVNAEGTLAALGVPPLPDVLEPSATEAAPAGVPAEEPAAEEERGPETLRGTLSPSAPVRRFVRHVGAGRVAATLTAPTRERLTLTLVDGSGRTLARASGRSPVRVERRVTAGPYRLIVKGRTRIQFTVSVVTPQP